VVSGEQINATPISRTVEIFEAAPGLIANSHSAEGKAPQYFLRGFQLDHGTDFLIMVDGMPVNIRTNAHGQAYADVNFLIPELIASMDIRKGPYFVDTGDFSSAGSARITLKDKLEKGFYDITVGSFGYQRYVAGKSYSTMEGNLLIAGSFNRYNGPWDIPDNMNKLNGLIRYSRGTPDDGFSITGMAYDNSWHATNVIPQRAVDQGLISRFGTIDPTDGASSSRYSLSGRFASTNDYGVTRLDAYAIRYSLMMWNNFTFFLDDPVRGDQFRQTDERAIFGGHLSHTFKGRLGPFDSDTVVGVQSQHDDIGRLELFRTMQRVDYKPLFSGSATETNVSPYIQNTTKWTPWLRTVLGVRYDDYWGTVAGNSPDNSGKPRASLTSPKAGVVLGPFYNTELFANAGTGFHSNDLRGVTTRIDPNSPNNNLPITPAPFLVRSKGAEVGVRIKPVPGYETSVTAFILDFRSELQYSGDSGAVEPGRPSRRTGIEWTNQYRPVPWLYFTADLAVSHARFTDFDPAGSRVPGAPNVIATAGVTYGEKTGWFGAAKFRFLGPTPLIEDNSVRSHGMKVVNATLGYRFDNGYRLQLDAFNLLNSKDHQIDYFQEGRLFQEARPPGEPPGVMDVHFKPVEPLAVRLTLGGTF
jgi:outer membrane receptor protein involved in Fe transport